MSGPLHADAWSARLRELLDAHAVPGAVLGVSCAGERVVVAAGVAGLRNPVPVTADTVFQLGSISKLYTSSLLLSLVGPEILDRPVAELVPEARWMDPAIHVGHLLTHSSGLGGDWFHDSGRGEDCLARYVAELAAQPRDVPLAPGERYSYCNSGFAVLGRLIEVLCGQSFDDALRERLLDPLGAAATSTLPEQTIMHPVALGHNRDRDGPLTADARWNFARACGPLGGICATADDLLTFAELHLADGRTRDGTALLTPDVARLMRARQLECPPLSRPSARGLGFCLYDWPGAALAGHDGETLGQMATLRVDVARGLALVVLTNAVPDGDGVAREMERTVLSSWDLAPAPLPAPVRDPAFDPRPYEGRYRNLMGTFDVAGEPGGLRVVARYSREGLDDDIDTTHLRPLGDGAFIDASVRQPTRALRFADPDPDAAGRCRSYFTGRIAWRVDDA